MTINLVDGYSTNHAKRMSDQDEINPSCITEVISICLLIEYDFKDVWSRRTKILNLLVT
jgi:hypothetical protein